MHLLSIDRWISSRSSALLGVVLILSGVTICVGWATGNVGATRLYFEGATISIIGAVEFILSGTAFIVPHVATPRVVRPVHRLIAAFMLGLSTFGAVGLCSDVLTRHLALPPPMLGMNPAAIVVFSLIGVLLITLASGTLGWKKLLIQYGTACIAVIGVVLILNEYINTDYIFMTGRVKPAALGGAILLFVVAAGMWGLWRDAEWNQTHEDINPSTIYLTLDVLVTLIVATIALVAFGLSQGRSQEIMRDQMRIEGKDKRNLFDTILRAHIDKAVLISERPGLASQLFEIEKNPASGAAKVAALIASARALVGRDFSAISISMQEGTVVASAGNFALRPEQRVQLAGSDDVALLWDDGYVLHTEFPLLFNAQRLGSIQTEQRMDDLTRMQREAISGPQTSDMVVCKLIEDKQHCFPFRWGKKSGQYPAYLDGKALPLTRAAKGETATDITTDFRRERVIAALGPIGNTGLGMAVKRDMADLYAPIRRQFFSTLPILFVLILICVGITRAKLHPLVKALESNRDKLKAIALTDTLTGLANRALFDDRLKLTMARAKRANSTMALMFVDLDKFKLVNDRYGHNAGDELLKWCATQMRLATREIDSVARLGGDEFTIILEDIPSVDIAERIARSVIDAIGRYRTTFPLIDIDGFGASIGIAFYCDDRRTAKELMADADKALYQSKNSGRGSYRIAAYEDVAELS